MISSPEYIIYIYIYACVKYRYSNGILLILPCSIGNTSSMGPFSVAMLVYRSVLQIPE